MAVDGWEGYPSRRAAIAELTRRIEESLKDLIVEASSQSEMAALRTVRVVWDQERGRPLPRTLAAQHRRHRVFARALARLRETRPEALEEILAETDAYRRALDLAGIPPELLQGRYTFGRVLRFLLTRGLATLVGLPLAWLAAIVTWPGRKLGDVLAQRAWGGTEDMRALCRMLGGGAFLVLFAVLGAVAAGVLWGPWPAVGVLIGLPSLLAFHVMWQDHRREVHTRVRAFLLLAGATLRETLQERRHALYERLRSVADEIERPEAETR
jgi:hypothetical protein